MSTSPTPKPHSSRSNSRPSSPSKANDREFDARRRAEKRRRAINARLRRFDATLPSFGFERNPFPLGSITAVGFTGLAWSKMLSLALLAGVVVSLFWIQADSSWYVYSEDTRIRGQQLVSQQTLYDSLGIDGWNSLWLRRDQIRERLLRHPWITDARVSIAAPARVEIQVTEAPAIGVWLTKNGQFWISPKGSALPMAEQPPAAMPRLIDGDMEADVPGAAPGTAVDTRIVASALALIGRVPGVTEVRYNADIGLNFGLPGTSLWIYWGDGELAEQKLEAIALGRQMVAAGDVAGTVLDVRFPDRPFVR